MIILTLLYLVCPIISATAIPAGPPPTVPVTHVQPGRASCVHVYGDQVGLADCFNALNQMQHHVDNRHAQANFVGPFSVRNPDPVFSLPRIWRTPTCTIGLDIKNPNLSLMVNWANRVTAAQQIVHDCVVPSHVGGDYHSDEYFLTLVVNEQRMDQRLLATWIRCLTEAGHDCGALLERALSVLRAAPGPSGTHGIQ